MAKSFKGYVLPGAEVPGLAESEFPPDTTLDALAGHFRLFQYAKGHRFSTDERAARRFDVRAATPRTPTLSELLTLS